MDTGQSTLRCSYTGCPRCCSTVCCHDTQAWTFRVSTPWSVQVTCWTCRLHAETAHLGGYFPSASLLQGLPYRLRYGYTRPRHGHIRPQHGHMLSSQCTVRSAPRRRKDGSLCMFCVTTVFNGSPPLCMRGFTLDNTTSVQWCPWFYSPLPDVSHGRFRGSRAGGWHGAG